MEVQENSGHTGNLIFGKEPDMDAVVEAKGDTGVVYAICSETDNSGKISVVHRNHLLPCSSLPLKFPMELQKASKTRKTKLARRK